MKGNQVDLFQEVLELLNIQYFVAPYEADAQMAYMVRKNYAQFAISEDSDLLPFGCPKILTKLNQNGFGQLIDITKIRKQKKSIEDEKLQTLAGMSHHEFILACVMAGCEYMESIQRVGLKVVCKLFKKTGSIEGVITDLQNNKIFKDRVPDGYLEQIEKTATIFLFQTVYDPIKKKWVQNCESETEEQNYE